MSARGSSASRVRSPVALSTAYSAEVLRVRESARYRVLPSRVKPRVPVVSTSSNGMSSDFSQAAPARLRMSMPPSGRERWAKRRL